MGSHCRGTCDVRSVFALHVDDVPRTMHFLQLDFRAVAFLGQENLPSLKPSRDVFAASPEQDGLALCSSDVHGQGPQKGQCVPLA